jgi:hypothetical protein
MRFVIDLDSLELIESATDRRRVTQVEGKRGDDSPFEVVFVRSGVAEELAGSTVLTFGAKQEGKYDAAAVVLEDGFALSGSGTTAKYSANPSFNTAALNALFLIDANDANDPAYVDLMAEFTWQIGAGAPTSTKTFRFRVHNDVVRDDEVSPTPAYSPIGNTAPTNLSTAWTERESNRAWLHVASSSDGTKLVATVNGGQIYTSTDSGATWTARDSNRAWQKVASSSDGTKLVAIVTGGQIYTSTDSGATWTARDSARNWYSVASSSDGTKLVATVNGGQIYTSTDSGATWTARDFARNWRGVASSANGTKLVAVVFAGQIYTSTDSGATWTARDSARNWGAVGSSSDGTKLVASVEGGQIYTSTDSGVIWTARASSGNWYGIASSSSGEILAASDYSNRVHLSNDAGGTWQELNDDRNWFGLALSDSGNFLIAVVNAGKIYTIVPSITTAAPPYIRTAGGFLYIQESGVWKKTALSAL